MTVLRYSLLRLMLLFGCLLVFSLVLDLFGVHNLTLLIGLTAVSSISLSYFLLRGPRQQMAQQLADRVSGRLGPEPVDQDADAEDAEDEQGRSGGLASGQREGDPEQ